MSIIVQLGPRAFSLVVYPSSKMEAHHGGSSLRYLEFFGKKGIKYRTKLVFFFNPYGDLRES